MAVGIERHGDLGVAQPSGSRQLRSVLRRAYRRSESEISSRDEIACRHSGISSTIARGFGFRLKTRRICHWPDQRVYRLPISIPASVGFPALVSFKS